MLSWLSDIPIAKIHLSFSEGVTENRMPQGIAIANHRQRVRKQIDPYPKWMVGQGRGQDLIRGIVEPCSKHPILLEDPTK